jgi:hypothetical protein
MSALLTITNRNSTFYNPLKWTTSYQSLPLWILKFGICLRNFPCYKKYKSTLCFKCFHIYIHLDTTPVVYMQLHKIIYLFPQQNKILFQTILITIQISVLMRDPKMAPQWFCLCGMGR